MDKLFNSKFMQNIQKWGEKLGQNKFLNALQIAMMSSLSVLMVGAIFSIIQTILGPNMLHIISMNDVWYNFLNIPYQFGMESLSLWLVLLLAYHYAKKINVGNSLMSMLDATVCFLIVATPVMNVKGITALDVTYLSTKGMFVAMFVAFVVVRLEKIISKKGIKISLPDSVPPALQKSFEAMLPMIINVTLFWVISVVIFFGTHGQYTFASGFMQLISVPLAALISTPGVFILVFIALTLWTFGIHGAMAISAIQIPLIIQAIGTNAALHAAGNAVKFNAVFLLDYLGACGGSGNTFPLVIMGLRAKSSQIRAVSKAELIPGLFDINEPEIFGMPIMYNPVLAIPFVLNSLVLMALTLVAYKVGFIMPAWIPVFGSLPIGVMSFLQTLHWQNLLWIWLLMIPSGLIWYPFFKAYDNQLYKEEQSKNSVN